MTNRIWKVVLTLFWVGMIFLVFYTAQDMTWSSGYWERRVKIYFNLDRETSRALVVTVRKGIHFSYYGLLALVSQVSFRLWGIKRPVFAAGLGVVLALMVAMADEYRQSLTNFRSGKIGDVALDLAGAFCFTILAGWIQRKAELTRKRRHRD